MRNARSAAARTSVGFTLLEPAVVLKPALSYPPSQKTPVWNQHQSSLSARKSGALNNGRDLGVDHVSRYTAMLLNEHTVCQPPRPIPARPVPWSMLREKDWMSGFLDLPLPNECENTKDQETEWRYKPPAFPLMCRMPQIAENNGREDKQIWQGTFTPTGRTTPLHQLDCNNHDPKKHPVQQQN